MKKKTEWRTCSICDMSKRTTNNEEPFIGEECLRTKGRLALLAPKDLINLDKQPNPMKGAIIAIAVFLAGLVVGIFLF